MLPQHLSSWTLLAEVLTWSLPSAAEYVLHTVFLLDLTFKFYLAYEDNTGAIVTGRKQIAKHYLK